MKPHFSIDAIIITAVIRGDRRTDLYFGNLIKNKEQLISEFTRELLFKYHFLQHLNISIQRSSTM